MKKPTRLAVLAFGLLALLVTPAAVADPPTLIVNDRTAEATGSSGAVVSYSVTATDDNGPPGVVCTPASGEKFPLGTTSVSCTATDTVTGETTTQSFNVTVRDTTRPSITVPGSKTVEATGPSGASVGYSGLSATDTVSGSITPSCSPSSGSTFPLGTTTVSCTATDGAGNSASDSFSVTVRDTTAPTVGVPSGKTVEATSSAGAAVTFSGVSASDTVSGNLTANCSRSSGSTFPLGTTTVTCTVTDGAGNSASNSFSVTVNDTTPPVVTVPAGKTVEATGSSGAKVTYSGAKATDAVSGNITPSCSPGSGSTFRVGVTDVVCTATDGAGNKGSASFKITVRDTTPPVLSLPGGTTAEATGPSGAKVSYSGASATDTVDGSITPSCSPGSGSTFSLGTTSVNCTAKDDSGNRASGSFTVKVQDTTPPVVTVPAATTADATSGSGAKVTYSGVSANDLVSKSLTPTCDRPSGSTFPIGTTTVKCTATDGAGNSGSASFPVTVRDAAGPELSGVHDSVVEASGPKGAHVSYPTPTAVDGVDGPVPTSCSPGSGSLFPLGPTKVTCHAKDLKGNAASASWVVTVVDTKAPVLTAPAPITVSSHGAESLPASAAAIASFLKSAVSSDLVDGNLSVSNDAPAVFRVGTTKVTFSTKDKSRNDSEATSRVTVVKEAVAPTKPLDRTPPQNVRGLKAKAADRAVKLSWRSPPDRDFDHVVISRAKQAAGPAEIVVYRGPAKRYVDRRLKNGVDYRYVVVSYDHAGNRSAGIGIVAAPKASMLVSPPDAARVKAPPLLRWVEVPGASYYNVQLFRGASRVKILSIWPGANRLQLPATWVFEGRRQRLSPGLYHWYVWPGHGVRAGKNYGRLLGEGTFTVVARKKK